MTHGIFISVTHLSVCYLYYSLLIAMLNVLVVTKTLDSSNNKDVRHGGSLVSVHKLCSGRPTCRFTITPQCMSLTLI